jgi:hypothetical protein
MFSIPPPRREGILWSHIADLLDDAAADNAPVAEVEKMLLRGMKVAGLI